MIKENKSPQSSVHSPQSVSRVNCELLLGTAMWGWNVSKERAFQLLDYFYEKGFRQVDSATNYPINKNPANFRRAEIILQEWVEANGVQDLQVMMKIGSINNMRSPEHNLSKSFILMNLEDYRFKFGKNLHTLMLHWDNRNDEAAIRESLEALDIARKEGLKIGMSGIKHPEIYAKLNEEYKFDFCFQMKHNLLHSDYQRYKAFHGKRRFITYGINAGGLKLDVKNYDENSSLKTRGGDIEKVPPIVEKVNEVIRIANQNKERLALNNFNQIGMLYAFYSPDILGILLGCSRLEQLKASIGFLEVLKGRDYLDVYNSLLEVSNY